MPNENSVWLTIFLILTFLFFTLIFYIFISHKYVTVNNIIFFTPDVVSTKNNHQNHNIVSLLRFIFLIESGEDCFRQAQEGKDGPNFWKHNPGWVCYAHTFSAQRQIQQT
jgi:hypothetical protein